MRRVNRATTALFASLALGTLALAILPQDRGHAQTATADIPAATQRQPMLLGAASNFSQAPRDRLYEQAFDLPVLHYRDGGQWRFVETQRGQYRFDHKKAAYPARLAELGGDLVLTLNWGNRLYDNGTIPHTPQAVAAFGKFAAQMAAEHPAIVAIEVGNEFNSANFVNGPIRRDGIAQRGRYHLALLRSVAQEVRKVRPDVRVLGGATHSIAAGYLWPILDEAEPGLIDGLAIHPYTTPIDQLAAQFAVLRQHPAARDMPIDITEFGSREPEKAADHLLRGYASLASLGAASLYWYPLNARGDRHVPLINRRGDLTSAGRAYRHVQQRLATRLASDISPDPFTKIHRFDEDTLVLWGEPRTLSLAASGLVAHNAQGDVLHGELMLDPERAILIQGNAPIVLSDDIQLGCTTLLADTYYQFRFPDGRTHDAPQGRFNSYAEIDAQRVDWEMRPGQERAGVPWMPYLSTPGPHLMRLTADSLLIDRRSAGTKRIVHEYRAPTAQMLVLEAVIDPLGQNATGMETLIKSGAETIWQSAGDQGVDQGVDLTIPVAIAANQPLRIITQFSSGRGNGRANYRLRLRDPARCATDQ